MMHRILFCASILFVCVPVPLLAGGGLDPKGVEFFEAKIRPVLSKHCYECHSAQAKRLRAELLLDTKAGMLKGGESGPVLVPGKAKDSLIIKALLHDGPTKMPSQSTKLPREIIGDFVKWIDMGAPDPRDGKIASRKKEYDIEKARGYWAFAPFSALPPPAVKNTSWPQTPVDRFILAKLEEKGLTPNGPARAERLLRRAYFDLTGLPPAPAEVEEFVKAWEAAGAKRGEIWAKLIDRLLESPRHGERWARHWLDTVRFAESGGYEFDGNRPAAYHYRDFVIKALNQDMPFDQFVRWQIAGDHLAPGNLDAIAATGFLVAGSYPGQTTAKTLALIRYDHLDDMVSTLGTSMLGLSLGCARCHEHKYDPIPQEDYYRLVAALGRTDSANVKVVTDPETYGPAKAAFDKAHAPLVKARDDFEATELPKRMSAWWQAHKDQPTTTWLYLNATEAKGKNPLQKQPDGSLKATGKAEKNEVYTIVSNTMQKKITALRIEALADGSLPKMGPGRGPNGEFVLSEISLQAAPLVPTPGKGPVAVKLGAGKASAEADKFPLKAALDGDKKTGWSVGALVGKDQAAIFEIDGNIGFDGGTILTVTLKFEADSYAIGKPRLAISTTASPALDAPADHQHAAELLAALGPTPKEFAPVQRASLVRWMRRVDPQINQVYKAVEEHAKTEPKPNLIDVFAAQSGRGGPVNFLVRGEPEKKREVMNPGFVQVLMNHADKDQHWVQLSPRPAGGEGLGVRGPSPEPRVALASWLTDTEYGAGKLLARVIVNRLWQHHMGKGIVATPNDFGVQGDPPTHPELLDFLAAELVKNGWRLKPIHKLIMTSAVYMQSNAVNDANLKADPQNRLCWRHPTRRLEAEAIRDNLLAVAGTLDLKMYGPGTLDGNTPRRSIYLTVKRSQMIPLLQMFDAPEALQSIGERSVTTVPTQSLAFMNSPLVRSAAQKLAARVHAKPAGERSEPAGSEIEQAYLIALARRPNDAERQRMESFIASYGTQGHDQGLVDFCQVLLCLNEFIYVD